MKEGFCCGDCNDGWCVQNYVLSDDEKEMLSNANLGSNDFDNDETYCDVISHLSIQKTNTNERLRDTNFNKLYVPETNFLDNFEKDFLAELRTCCGCDSEINALLWPWMIYI